MFLGKLLCGLFLGYLSVGQNYFEYVEDLGQGSLGTGNNRAFALCKENPCYVYNKNGDFTYAHCGDRNCSPANRTETVIMAGACGARSCPASICRPAYHQPFFANYGVYINFMVVFSAQLRGRVYYVSCQDETCLNHTVPKVVVTTHVDEVECALIDYHEVVISISTPYRASTLIRCDADNGCNSLLSYFVGQPPFSFKKIGLLTYNGGLTINVFLDYSSRLFILQCYTYESINGLCIPYFIDGGVSDNYFAVEQRSNVIMIVYPKFENGLWHLKLAICSNPNRMACDDLEIRSIANYTGGLIGDPSITYYRTYYSSITQMRALISYVANNKLQLVNCSDIYCTKIFDIQTREDSASVRGTSTINDLGGIL